MTRRIQRILSYPVILEILMLPKNQMNRSYLEILMLLMSQRIQLIRMIQLSQRIQKIP
jgi:hypothetical protein